MNPISSFIMSCRALLFLLLQLCVHPGMAVVRFIRRLGAQSASIGSEKGDMMERIPFVIWRIITGATFPRVGIGRGIIIPAVPPLAALVD